MPAFGTFGNAGRNIVRGPGQSTVDLSLFRTVRTGESVRWQFRLEAFNVLNRANFAPPNLSVFAGAPDVEPPLPNFGRIRSTVTSARRTSK